MSRSALVVVLVLVLAGVVILAVVLSRPGPLTIPEAPEGSPTVKSGPRFEPLPGPEPGSGEPGSEGAVAGAEGADAGTEEAPTGQVRGVVLDDRGRPVGGVRVGLADQDLGSKPIGYPWSGVTDPEGHFEVMVPPGRIYEAAVHSGGYVQEALVEARADGSAVEIRLRRLLSILGVVVDDATGESVDRAALLLQRLTDGGEPAPGPASGYRAEGGSFVLSDLAAGRYRLTATVAGYDAWQGPDLVLTKEEPHVRVEARVSRTGVWGAVVLSLVAPDGSPVEQVNRVILHHPDSGFLAMTGLGAPAPVRLEAPQGRHVVQVQADGYLPEIRAVEVPGGTDTEISITLREAGHVHVLVTDGAGKPTAGYRLRIFDGEGEELEYDLRIGEVDLTVGASSGFEDEGEDVEPLQGTVGKAQEIPGGDVTLKNLMPGRYRLEATREGLTPAEQTFDVEARGTVEVSLTLR